MSASKTLAFVLKKQDYRDTSLLVDLYTQEFGRLRGIVKGVRDSRARFGTTFEPFSLNEILVYKRKKGNDLHLVTQAELVTSFSDLYQEVDRFAAACYCMELVSELVEPDEAAPEIFTLIQDTLKFLSSGASIRRAARIFEVKLFEALGLMPEVRACIFCHTEPNPSTGSGQGGAYFNQALGGIHCKDCGTKQKQLLGGTSLPVSQGTLVFLGHVRREPIEKLYSVKVSQEVGSEIEKVLRRWTDFHLNHKLKTLTFMEKAGIS